jgi:antitoxin component YwqK of YwqJK toxin-antitoxin module
MNIKIRSLFSLFVITACSLSFVYAQSDNINQTDANGMKQGFWRVTYENGKTKYEGSFKDNKPVGLLKRYYDDGTIKAEINFGKTGKKAYAKMYYQNGLIAGEGNFIESMRDSIWKFYSFYDSTIRTIESYKNGIKDGPSSKYYTNGKVAEELTYQENKKSGPWRQYFEDGTLKLKATYINDKREGEYIMNYPSGKPETKGVFTNNLMEGSWIYLDEEGKTTMTIQYINGIPQNTKEMDKKNEEFFKKIEENKGKIPEPDETNAVPTK